MEVVITRGDDGQLTGLGEKGARAWARFVAALKNLDRDSSILVIFRVPRSPRFHRRHFAILGAVFKCQEQFHDEEQFRLWTQVGAGHCDFVPGPTGRPVALPRSVAWHRLEDIEFREVHEATISFLRSAHATRFLWPHLSDIAQSNMIDAVLEEFGS